MRTGDICPIAHSLKTVECQSKTLSFSMSVFSHVRKGTGKKFCIFFELNKAHADHVASFVYLTSFFLISLRLYLTAFVFHLKFSLL